MEVALQRGERQVLEGRILRAEAAAQPLMKTALSMLADRGIIKKNKAARHKSRLNARLKALKEGAASQ